MKNIFNHLANRSLQTFGKGRLKKKIFFIHMAKCGGTSIEKAIRSRYQTLDPRNDSRLHRIEAIPARTAIKLSGMNNFLFRETMLLYYMARSSTLCVSGHFPFSEIAFRQYGSKFKFLTVLRQPVKRWLSQYFHHLMNTPEHPDKTNEDLETFIKNEQAREFGATYVRAFRERGSDTDWYSDNAIASAIVNIDKMHLVGCLENLPQFAADFETEFGVELKIPHLNTSRASKKQKRQLVDKSLLEKIEDLCAPDIAVYNHLMKPCSK